MNSYYGKDDVFVKVDSTKKTMETRIKNETVYGTFKNSELFKEFVGGVEAAIQIADHDMQELQINFYRTKNDYCHGTITDVNKLRAFHQNIANLLDIWNELKKMKEIA